MKLTPRSLPRWTSALGALAMSLQMLALPAQAGAYDEALAKTKYDVLAGDVNGDGKPDLLVKAAPRIVLINLDDDLMVPIPLPPASPSFVLLSNPSGNFYLASPDAQMLAFAGWTPANYALSFTGAEGGLAGSMTLTAAVAGQPIFTVAMAADSGQLQLTGTSSANAMLAIDCSNFSPVMAPKAASSNCAVSNKGRGAINAIAYSAIGGATVSGPTGPCAPLSSCGNILVLTGNTPVTANGTLTATPDAGTGASVSINLVVTPHLSNGAEFVEQTVPDVMRTGQAYSVVVKMKNTGGTTWAAGTSYKLGSQNPADNATWAANGRVVVGNSVPPGQTHAFTFDVTAPAPGVHNFQWKMVEEGVEWFGVNTPNVGIAVSPPDPVVTWNAVLAALSARDQTTLLSHFMDRPKYEQIFSAMGNNLSDLAATLSDFEFTEISAKHATGVVNQTVNGRVSQHYVSFVCVDGVWYIVNF